MKKTLREQILLKRKGMARSEVLEKSMRIKDFLFSSAEYQNARSILFYVSYNNEVHTHEMIQESLRNGKTVVIPKTDVQKKKLVLSYLNCWDDLVYGAFNILEPKDDCFKEASLDLIDVLIIPGVAFDGRGNRIGHGHGYYDKLLHSVRNKPKIGLAFELQIVEGIPTEKHDIKVDRIVTEQRIIICS